jgi:hypothetical protein
MKRINLRNTGICSACAVTLGMEKHLEEEELVLQDGTIETSDVESKDTLLHSDGDICRYFIDKEQITCLDTDEN